MFILLCGIEWRNDSNEISDLVDYRYLAISTSSSISISITYILFLTKMQKRQTLEKGLPLLENDITTSDSVSK
jgi:hypothetical protein